MKSTFYHFGLFSRIIMGNVASYPCNGVRCHTDNQIFLLIFLGKYEYVNPKLNRMCYLTPLPITNHTENKHSTTWLLLICNFPLDRGGILPHSTLYFSIQWILVSPAKTQELTLKQKHKLRVTHFIRIFELTKELSNRASLMEYTHSVVWIFTETDVLWIWSIGIWNLSPEISRTTRCTHCYL